MNLRKFTFSVEYVYCNFLGMFDGYRDARKQENKQSGAYHIKSI